MSRLPDLQELVRTYGTYSDIPPEAWARYDRAIAEYRNAKIDQLRDEQMQNQLPRRRT